MTTPTKSQAQAADAAALLRARNGVLWVNSGEEVRTELYLVQACASAGYAPIFWDCGQGLTDLMGKQVAGTSDDHADPGITLDWIRERARGGAERTVVIMRDLHKWLDGPVGIRTSRQLRNLARELPPLSHSIIILAPSNAIPPELASGDAVVLDWPRPDRTEIGAILDTTFAVAKRGKVPIDDMNGSREVAIDAAIGLTGLEAESCFAKSLVLLRRIDPQLITNEKKRIIAKSGVLEWMEPLAGGLAAVGGLDGVKTWVTKRAAAFSPRARAYGLQPPKGIMLVGISGCGKSYTPKALATEWRCPLVRFDFGALKGKYVGQSEGNLRSAIRTIDSLGPCIVLVDEIEKALAGATQGAADGGVSADALGTFLGWMNDRTSAAFVVATANDISAIVNNAPELLRKGRFDELFFVDLPNEIERVQILEATLRQYKREVPCESLVDATKGFTGAELASLIPEALFTAFADNERELVAADIAAAARSVVPLSETAKEKIAQLRAWAATRARPATTLGADERIAATGRALDL